MAIASVGTCGTGVASASGTSFTLTTATNALSASGDIAILTVASDNVATTDGASNTHTSVSGGNGVWTKLGEYTNNISGAGTGACVSLWRFRATGTNAVGTVFTINHATLVDRCASLWKFTVTAGSDLVRAHPPTGYGVDASNGFGSNTISGLASLQRLYIMGGAKEANSTVALTPSTNFTITTATRSRNNAAAILVRGEFRINTSTGETSNPTMAVVGDTAAFFVALFESSAGSPSASPSASASASASPSASVSPSASRSPSASSSPSASASASLSPSASSSPSLSPSASVSPSVSLSLSPSSSVSPSFASTLLVDHQVVNFTGAFQNDIENTNPDASTMVIRLDRCTPQTPTIWPNASTFVTMFVSVSADAGVSWRQVSGFGASGGIAPNDDEDIPGASPESYMIAKIPAGTNRIRLNANANETILTRVTVEVF